MKRPVAIIAALLTLPATCRAIDFPDMPPMKEGLWKLHMTDSSDGKTPTDTTYSLCRDHASDQHAHELAQKFMSSCTVNSDAKLFGKRTIAMSCKIAGTTMVFTSTLSTSGETYVRSESTITYDPPLYGSREDKMVQEQTYVGACPAGMSPGDRMLADGTIRHHGAVPR